MIDSILIDDLVYISRDEEAIRKLRDKWDEIYDRVDLSVHDGVYRGYEGERPEGYIPGNYRVPTDDGFIPGLGAPMG